MLSRASKKCEFTYSFSDQIWRVVLSDEIFNCRYRVPYEAQYIAHDVFNTNRFITNKV